MQFASFKGSYYVDSSSAHSPLRPLSSAAKSRQRQQQGNSQLAPDYHHFSEAGAELDALQHLYEQHDDGDGSMPDKPDASKAAATANCHPQHEGQQQATQGQAPTPEQQQAQQQVQLQLQILEQFAQQQQWSMQHQQQLQQRQQPHKQQHGSFSSGSHEWRNRRKVRSRGLWPVAACAVQA